MRSDLKDLSLLLDSSVPLLVIESHDEQRVLERDHRPEQFDLQRLAELTDGFSGAEIEQTVVSALYTVSAMEEPLSMTHLESAIENTNPLSVVMFEKIAGLRQWARERCVFTD